MRIALLAATLALILPAAAQAAIPSWSQREDRAATEADKQAHIHDRIGLGQLQAAGEDISDPIPIPSLPFSTSGNTCNAADDYDEICPYYAPGSPDLVYAYTPATNQSVDISLCASLYDTKLYIYDGSPSVLVACNDDAGCGITGYQSALQQVHLTGGHTYYVVVDGYDGDCGDYSLDIHLHQSCIACQVYDQPEGEASCFDGYVDTYNAGCNAVPTRVTPVTCGTVCGTTGNFVTNGTDARDTDWYRITVGPGTFTYTGTADGFPMRLFVLTSACPPTSLGTLVTTPCVGGSLTFTGPGTFYLFASTSGFSGVPCGSRYRLDISGPGILACQAAPALQATWGNLKLRYR